MQSVGCEMKFSAETIQLFWKLNLLCVLEFRKKKL